MAAVAKELIAQAIVERVLLAPCALQLRAIAMVAVPPGLLCAEHIGRLELRGVWRWGECALRWRCTSERGRHPVEGTFEPAVEGAAVTVADTHDTIVWPPCLARKIIVWHLAFWVEGLHNDAAVGTLHCGGCECAVVRRLSGRHARCVSIQALFCGEAARVIVGGARTWQRLRLSWWHRLWL